MFYHGGGMAMSDASGGQTLMIALAHHGIVCVNVDFRNSTVAPFPGGLEDCLLGAIWANEHKDLLEITSQISVMGVSGGSNLAIATTLLALQRGHT